MTFMTVQQAAEKWGVSVRQVQRLLAAERIPDAQRHGRTWLIPTDAQKPEDIRKERNKDAKEVSELQETHELAYLLPVMNGEFAPGEISTYIENLPEEKLRQIAWAEYAYFKGDGAEAVRRSEPFLNSEILSLRLTALILFTFANLPLGHIHQTHFGMEQLQELLKEMRKNTLTPQQEAMGMFVLSIHRVLLHLPLDDMPSIEPHLRHLPRGLRAFACYVMAHKVYLEGDYGRALGIAETALMIQDRPVVISSVYLHLVAAMSLMAMKRTEQAKTHFMAAWELAQPDDLLEGFGEHHGLLHGLIETCLQDAYPEDYRRIIAITYSYSAGWRKVHNPETGENVADNLTTTEFTIAMLANRGWTNAEIAAHLRLSEHTVKRYVSEIYQKLGISSRKQLQQFMLR
ncbi:LuxR C-terminal-related transcriptional regulator [Anaerotignum sp.]